MRADKWPPVEIARMLLGHVRVSDDSDTLAVEEFATRHLPLEDAPRAYETFQRKKDGAFKILLQP